MRRRSAALIAATIGATALIGVAASGAAAPPSPHAINGSHVQLVAAGLKGDHKRAVELQLMLQPLHRLLFIESNPIPVKAALAIMGQIEEEYRLPLVPIGAKNRQTLRATLKTCGLLK